MSKILLTVLLTMSLSPVWAESTTSLDRWVQEALQNHPAISALEAEVDAAQAEKSQASLSPANAFAIEGGYKETDTDSGYAVGAELSMTAERGGKRDVRTALAESHVTQAELAVAAFRSELAFNINVLGLEYLVADRNAESTRAVADRCQAMIDQLKQRPVAGPPAFLELKVIEASMIDLQYASKAFVADRDALQIEMNTLLGRAADTDLELSAFLTPPEFQFDRDALMKKLSDSPILQEALAKQARQALEVKAATLESRQDIEWGPFIEREDAGEVETVVGLSVSFPLAGSKRNQGNIAAAKAQQLSFDAQLKLAKQEIQGELEKHIRLYDLATGQLEGIPAETIQELRGAADLADRQYRLGTIPVQLFLEMQQEHLNISQLYNEAMLSAWKHALKIQWLTGTLTEDAR